MKIQTSSRSLVMSNNAGTSRFNKGMVAEDMEMSVGGARYYIRAATEGKSREVRQE